MKRRTTRDSWPAQRGDPYHYLMIPHADVTDCAAYIEERSLRLNPKRPEWKLFWTDPRAWYHTAASVRVIPSEILELVRIAEHGECLSATHLETLRDLGTMATAAESRPVEAAALQEQTAITLAPLRSACDALMKVLKDPPVSLRSKFERVIVKRYDLVGRTAHVSPFGWLAAAAEQLQLHADCASICYHIHLEIILG